MKETSNHNPIPAVAHELAALLGRLVRDNTTDADERDNALDALAETMALAARNQRRASVKVKRRREAPRRSAYLARYGEQGHNYTLRNL